MYTLKDLIRRTIIVNPNSSAVISQEERLSWSAFHERIQKVSAGLVKRGLHKGDRVAILSPNTARYYELLYAVIWAGGVVAPINTRLAVREIVHCLDDLDGVWIACDASCLPLVESARESVDGVHGLLYLDDHEVPRGYVGLGELRKSDAQYVNEEPRNDDIALIYFTGGTTGVSKGVMLTHHQILSACLQSAAGVRSIGSKDVYLHVAPMFHMGDGVMSFVSPMTCCGNSFIDRFDLKRFIDICNRDQVTWATMVPTMLRGLCLYMRETGATVPTLKGVIYGGSPMPWAVLQLAMETLPGLEFVQGYGSTEALSITMLESKYHTLDEHGRKVLASAGRPFRGVLLGILDEQGNPVAQGSVGEVCVRSNAVMKGYWRRPQMTKEALRNNWFHTGDAGYLDEEGFLYLVDRVKDMIITGGENVYSAEVENVLLSHPDVEECAVIGIPDDKWGEAVHALIRCKSGRSATADALRTHCRNVLAGYKTPKSFEFRTDPLPRTAMGKVCKADLKKQYKATA